MQLNDATRIIDVIDQRIAKNTASNARVETTWGTVAAVSADGRYADLYLYGQSAPYTSDYFRLPNGLSVNVGNSVKAAIDRERGDRWIEEVHAFPTYNRVEFDIVDGEVRLGSGTAATDVRLYRSSTKTLTIDDGAGGSATVNVIGSLKENGSDVALLSDIPAVPAASATVASETAFDQSAAAGSAATYSRGDHTHGTPTNPVTAHEAAADPHTGYQKESEKGVANGYASLDASGDVPVAQVPPITTAMLATAAKRGKWVKLATYEQAIADGTTYTAAQTAITGREMTNLPTNAKAVFVTVYVKGTSTGQGSWQALDYGNTHIAAIAYYDAAQFSQYNTSSGIAELGGTNNRQIKFTLSYTAGTCTVYARVTHYYTEED